MEKSGVSNMKKRIWGFALLLLLLLLPSCKKEEVSSWQRDDLIRIDKETVNKEEARVYGIQIKKEFEEIGGADIWEYESFSGDKSAYEVAKTKVLENIIRVKILAGRAKDGKMELTEAERKEAENRAKQFYDTEAIVIKDGEETISLQTVQQVFIDFALGQKWKKEMLSSFRPTEEMIMAKLSQESDYLALDEEEKKESFQEYVLEYSEISNKPENQSLILAVQNALNENGVLTDEISRGMVYQEERYQKQELEETFGTGIAERLQNEDIFLPSEDASKFFVIHLKGIEITNPKELEKELVALRKEKERIREQVEEEIKEESFDVIYLEWKKDAEIQINQEVWQEYVVFSLDE